MLIPGLLILLALLSAAVFIWAWRGKRVGDEPTCRKCGFDLRGSCDASQCPECGAPLDQPRAVSRGQRTRRPIVASSAALVCVLSLAATGIGIWMGTSGSKYQHWLPVWALRYQANHHGRSAQQALAELLCRLQAGNLSKADVHAVAADALARQKNLNRSWNSAWGDFVQEAWNGKVLAKSDWQQYLANLVHERLPLEIRKVIRQGDPLPIRLDAPAARCGHHCPLGYDAFVSRVRIDALSETPGLERSCDVQLKAAKPFDDQGLPLWLASHLAPGRHELVVPVNMHLLAYQIGFPVVARYTYTVRRTFTVVPASKRIDRPVYDPKQAAAMRWALSVISLHMRMPSVHQPQRHPVLDGELRILARPYAMACDIIARDSLGHQWKLGSACFRAQRKIQIGLGVLPSNKIFNARQVDVVLVPNPKLAANWVHVHPYWSKPIIFKHLKVDWSRIPKAHRPGVAKSQRRNP